MHKIEIAGIQKGSIAEELGIETGDVLISINEIPIKDVFDYRFYCTDSQITVEIEKKNGVRWLYDIEKDEVKALLLQDVGGLHAVIGAAAGIARLREVHLN